MEKKAQMWQFLIMGLLGVAVLVIGVWLITTGNWRDYISTSNQNVGAVVFGCGQKCNTGDTRGYCVEPNSVVFEKGGKKEYYTCKALESVPNSGLSSCDKFDCNVQIVTCDALKVTCAGLPEGKCNVEWMDQATFIGASNDKVKYSEVSEITSRVTDLTDKKTATDNKKPLCVRTVLV